ncbi:MAG: class I SAM-dependent methyltransferase [Candidatus Levybacteria bacterium]|nr:class I SAM-dependent methyltransferase [Candidatus Levybacteria bacterium]
MKYILRNKSVITGKKNLEHLQTFKKFPVFMGCVDNQNEKNDLKADMSFSICRDSGMIQLDKVLPLDMVYLDEHADGVGAVWQKHYIAFAGFIKMFSIKNVLEVGGGNGEVAKLCTDDKKDINWTIIEPNPIFKGNKKIKVIKGWFDEEFKFKDNINTVIHSHVLEHMYDPDAFIRQITHILKKGDKHIFSLPNIYDLLLNKFTNSINFEHTIFLTEYFVDYLLKKNGFKIIKKKYFFKHSIFYATEKSDKNSDIRYISKYKEYKKMFIGFIDYHQNLINDLNRKIDSFGGEIYIFGAHIFSLYLFAFGLKKEKITAVLDNSELKHKKRLYGTGLNVYFPEVIKNKKNTAVILKAAAYQQEIKKQLINLNKNVFILE